MYPDLPYPGYTWHLTHHMGVLGERNLYNILWAALTYAGSRDPSAEINNYIIANNLVTKNVRRDSGQPDAWRDYQQMLSELGLIFSKHVIKKITLTPLGLAYLDKALYFSELLTLQAFRYQYPNGHNVVIVKKGLGRRIADTPYEIAKSLVELQTITGVNIQPAILIWRILRDLQQQGAENRLSLDEIQAYAMLCSTNSDSTAAVESIINFRSGNVVLHLPDWSRRNAQDWVKFLIKTPIFEGRTGKKAYLRISDAGILNTEQINAMCLGIEEDPTRWLPGKLDKEDRRRWYAWYGAINVNIYPIPLAEEPVEREDDEDMLVESDLTRTQISLRSFDQSSLSLNKTERNTATTIESSYSANLSLSQHRLHDLMVALIADTCRAKGASVWDDPKTVDLLVRYQEVEFIVEVKTVTPKNFVNRIRYALGQILYYDYLRSEQSTAPRRKVIAIAANVADTSWCIPFLNGYMDIDLLSMRNNVLHVHSQMPITNQLFTR